MFSLTNRKLILLAAIVITPLTHGASDDLQQQINELKAVTQQQKIVSEAAINNLKKTLSVVQSLGMEQLKKQKEEAEKALSEIKKQLSEAQAQIAALTKDSKEAKTPKSTAYQDAQAALEAKESYLRDKADELCQERRKIDGYRHDHRQYHGDRPSFGGFGSACDRCLDEMRSGERVF